MPRHLPKAAERRPDRPRGALLPDEESYLLTVSPDACRPIAHWRPHLNSRWLDGDHWVRWVGFLAIALAAFEGWLF